MLIQNNDNPLNSLYYIGFRFLSWVKHTNKRIFDIDELFNSFNTVLEKKINYGKYLLLLDWLHLNRCLDILDNGDIKINVFS